MAYDSRLPAWREKYLVKRDGTIWSRWPSNGTLRQLNPWLIKGYQFVELYADGKSWVVGVHTLVALAYCGPRPSPKHITRHVDGNPLNNSAENIAWGTTRENFEDRARHGRTSKGIRHGLAIRKGLPEYRHAPASLAMHYISEALNILRAGGRL